MASQKMEETQCPSVVKAALTRNLEQLKDLIENQGQDVNQVDKYGDTALHVSAKNNEEIVRYLLSKGASVNAQNNNGSTPLHKAAMNPNNVVIVDLLLKASADPTIKNISGFLPEQYTTDKTIFTNLIGDGLVRETILVPKSKHGLIIGKKGSTMSKIQQESSTMINIRGEENVIIMGRQESISKAKQAIFDIVSPTKNDQEESLKSKAHVKLPISKDKHRLVVGKGGATKKQIEQDYNVKITLPTSNSSDNIILITGDEVSEIEGAVKRIHEVCSAAKNFNNNSKQKSKVSPKQKPVKVTNYIPLSR